MNPWERRIAVALPLLGKLQWMCLNRTACKWGSFLLTLFILLLVMASPAMGAEKFCSDAPYFGVIDGNIRPVPTQITIDRDCTFQNFPQSKPLTTTTSE